MAAEGGGGGCRRGGASLPPTAPQLPAGGCEGGGPAGPDGATRRGRVPGQGCQPATAGRAGRQVQAGGPPVPGRRAGAAGVHHCSRPRGSTPRGARPAALCRRGAGAGDAVQAKGSGAASCPPGGGRLAGRGVPAGARDRPIDGHAARGAPRRQVGADRRGGGATHQSIFFLRGLGVAPPAGRSCGKGCRLGRVTARARAPARSTHLGAIAAHIRCDPAPCGAHTAALICRTDAECPFTAGELQQPKQARMNG